MLRHAAVFLISSMLLMTPGAASCQDPVLPPDTMPVADTIPSELPSPRGAFIRAVVVPGWGHAYVQEYKRAAIYGSIQGASWFMLVKTISRLGDVQDRDRLLTGLAEDSLAIAMAADSLLAEQLEDPADYEEALLTYPALRDTRSLVSARKQQRQDWVTYTLFFTFAAAVDAYVTAHLKDFPADVTAQPGLNGGLSLGVHIPVGRR